MKMRLDSEKKFDTFDEVGHLVSQETSARKFSSKRNNGESEIFERDKVTMMGVWTMFLMLLRYVLLRSKN